MNAGGLLRLSWMKISEGGGCSSRWRKKERRYGVGQNNAREKRRGRQEGQEVDDEKGGCHVTSQYGRKINTREGRLAESLRRKARLRRSRPFSGKLHPP